MDPPAILGRLVFPENHILVNYDEVN